MYHRIIAFIPVVLLLMLITAYALTIATVMTPFTVSSSADTTYVSTRMDVLRDSLYKFQWGARGTWAGGTLSLRIVPYFAGVPGDTLRLDSIGSNVSRYVTIKGDSIISKWFGGLSDTNNVAREIQKAYGGAQWKYEVHIQKRGPSGTVPLTWANRVTN